MEPISSNGTPNMSCRTKANRSFGARVSMTTSSASPTEAATRISDRADPVPDEIWEEAAQHYDQNALAALIIAIAVINVWNRLNVTVRQVVGDWKA